MAITKNQKLFADEYLIDLNATRAYKAAYPSCKKDESAAAAGNRLLRTVKVADYIEKRMKDREQRTEITQDMVIRELAAIAFANGSDFAKVVDKQVIDQATGEPKLNEDGSPKTYQIIELIATDDLPDDKKKALAGIKYSKYGIMVDTCDKVRSLELIGRHLGMFKDKVEVSGSLNTNNEKLDAIVEQLWGDDSG